MGGAIGAAFGAGSTLIADLSDGDGKVDWGRVGLNGLKGGIAGGIIGGTGCVTCGAGAAAVMGGLDGLVTEASQEDAALLSVMASTTSGAVVDGLSVLVGGGVGKVVGGSVSKSEIVGNTAGVIMGTSTQGVIDGATDLAQATTSGIVTAVETAVDALYDLGTPSFEEMREKDDTL